jgi:hypothetical protein
LAAKLAPPARRAPPAATHREEGALRPRPEPAPAASRAMPVPAPQPRRAGALARWLLARRAPEPGAAGQCPRRGLGAAARPPPRPTHYLLGTGLVPRWLRASRSPGAPASRLWLSTVTRPPPPPRPAPAGRPRPPGSPRPSLPVRELVLGSLPPSPGPGSLTRRSEARAATEKTPAFLEPRVRVLSSLV